MYEHRQNRPVERMQFLSRLARHVLAAALLLISSLAIGILGYMKLEHLSALDAFLNAAMLLGGMGPINTPTTPNGKLFAGFFALYAGLVFVVTAAMIITPVAHRLLHTFHWDDKL